MLYRFPPLNVDPTDTTFLTGDREHFVKLKIESKAGKRTVFLTEHTIIFVLKGVKLLHFADSTVQVGPDDVILLSKGIYVMAEYIEAGLNFEAIMLFLPGRLLQSLAGESLLQSSTTHEPFLLFPANELTKTFKSQLRQYFEQPQYDYRELLSIKQREILLLLISTGYRNQMARFIRKATSTAVQDLDYIVRAHVFQPVNIKDLANLANRSLASFKRDFNKLYHCSPRQWINQQRLAQAQILINNTDQRIADIAGSCGFESASHFIRQFKKQYGHTPGEQRAVLTID